MSAPDARSVVSEFVERCNTGTDPCALLSRDIVVTVNGTTPLSGRFPGLRLVENILVDTARVVISRLEISIREFVGGGPRLAALLAISGETAAGERFNPQGRTCGCVFDVDGGLITEIFLFPDTSLIETVLYRRAYVANDG